jgi:hypothetical protein
VAHRTVQCARPGHTSVVFCSLCLNPFLVFLLVCCEPLAPVKLIILSKLVSPIICVGQFNHQNQLGKAVSLFPFQKRYSARLRAQRSEQAPEGAPDSEQKLSGAPPDCPVAQLLEAPTVKTQQPSDVAGAPDSVRWCTGLSGAPYDSSLHQRFFGGWGYKYPPTTTLQCIQVFSYQTPYKSSRLHSKTQTKRSNPLSSPKIIPIK